MGKHKKKSKKHRHTSKKQHSSTSDSSSAEEWVEKESSATTDIKEDNIEKKCDTDREEWMSLPSLFRTSSSTDRRTERQEAKQKERDSAIYDPRKSVRELNPFWKNDGDGLPSLTQIKSKFKRPDSDENTYKSYKNKPLRSNWKKSSEKTFNTDLEPSTSKSNLSLEQNKTKSDIEDLPSESSDCLSAKEMNDIGAKIVKAEILGQTKNVEKLKEKLERAREYQRNHPEEEESVILYRSDSKGYAKPLSTSETNDNYKRKKNKIETHETGKRQKYYPDDDKYSLKQMYENEKLNTAEEQDAEFLKLTTKVSKMDDMDDMFVDKIRNEKSSDKNRKKERDKAISEHQQIVKSLDHCKHCLQSDEMQKHLMISLGETVYLTLPAHEPLTEGHCLLIPTRHVSCSTKLDENEWAEIMDFRKALTNMFQSENEDLIFYETVTHSNSYSHMILNCVPVPKEQGDLAPIYFKKAIDECETEWSTNKKLIHLAGKDVRRAVPKGLPYFFVSFGMSEGYAHVIEDHKDFPRYFAAEIIGGILDLHHSKWRKPSLEKFHEQKTRVLDFSDKWKTFDITVK